jgi:hypothetical protein
MEAGSPGGVLGLEPGVHFRREEGGHGGAEVDQPAPPHRGVADGAGPFVSVLQQQAVLGVAQRADVSGLLLEARLQAEEPGAVGVGGAVALLEPVRQDEARRVVLRGVLAGAQQAEQLG